MALTLERACGKILKRRREELGFSQEKLAELADLDRSYVSIVERGLKSVTLSTFTAICAVLGLAPEAVIGEARKAVRQSSTLRGGQNV